jgi:phospholipid transport system substrate-binding protein
VIERCIRLPAASIGIRALLYLLLHLLLLVPAGLLRPALAEEAEQGPAETVREVSEEVVGIIDRHRDSFAERPDAFYEAVDEAMAEFVDYRYISRAVMASYWSRADEAQRERFVERFRRGLVRSYGRAMFEFDQKEIEVLPIPPEHRRDDRALVRMEVTGANGRIYPVRYSVAQGEDGRWQVRNVIVDGVNLGRIYRNQFDSAMQSGDAAGDIDAVISSWSVAATTDA